MDFEKYCKTAISEYPRLCGELQTMTEKVANQIDGAAFTSVKKQVSEDDVLEVFYSLRNLKGIGAACICQ